MKKRYKPFQMANSQRPSDPELSSSMNRWDDPNYIGELDAAERQREAAKLPMRTADSVRSRPKPWLFKDWIEQRQLTLIAGLPDAGKSTFTCALAAAVTRGKDHPLFSSFEPTGDGHVIFICREDDIVTSLKARLYAAGADMSKIAIISDDFGEHGETPFNINSERDRARLIGYSESIKHRIGMIVLDPVYQAVDGDFNNDYKARAAYEGLVVLAKQLECAIVGVCHTVKNPRDKDPLARVAGPQALRLVPRSIILLSEITGQETGKGGTHVLLHAKHNNGKMNDGYEYALRPCCTVAENLKDESIVFEITGEVFGKPQDILEWADAKPEKIKKRQTPTENKTQIAKEFLLNVLAEGEMLGKDIVALAKEAGITKGTLMLAKSTLPIKAEKRTGDGLFSWRLVAETSDNEE